MISRPLSATRVALRPASASKRVAAFFCLALALLLVGCKTTSPPGLKVAGADVQHGSESANGLVLVGIRTNDGNPLYWSIGFRLTGAVEVYWRRFDPETDSLLRGRSNLYRSFRHWCSKYGNHPACNDDDYTQVQYNLSEVVPGRYLLESVRVTEKTGASYLSAERSLFSENSPNKRFASGVHPGFEVKPGEVVYIGDYVFDVNGEHAKFLRVESNPEQARAALALYPNVQGEMLVRVPEKSE